MKTTFQLLTESLSIISKNWLTILKIFVYSRLLYIPGIVIFILLFLLGGLADFIWLPFYLIFIIYIGVLEILSMIALFFFLNAPQEYQGLKHLFKKSVPYILPFWAMSALGGIVMAGGLLLFIVPGIIFYVWFVFAGCLLLFENLKGTDALSTSGEMVRQKFWPVLGRIVLINLIILVLYLILNYGLDLFPFFKGDEPGIKVDPHQLGFRIPTLQDVAIAILILIGKTIAGFFLFAYSTTYTILLYKDLKASFLKPNTTANNHHKVLFWAIPLLGLILFAGLLGGYAFFKYSLPSDPSLTRRDGIYVAPEDEVTPTEYLSPTPIPNNYWDPDCSFSLIFDGEIKEDWSKGYKTIIFISNEPPHKTIEASCRKSIPRPQVPAENIHQVKLDGQIGTLYQDETVEGSRRRYTIIIKHVDKDFEISLTGFGDFFHQHLPGFGFIWG